MKTGKLFVLVRIGYAKTFTLVWSIKFVLIKSSVTRVYQAGVSEAIDGSKMPVKGSVM